MRRLPLSISVTFLAAAAALAQPRPPEWATRLALPGVPNLHRLDAHVYRSAQPSARGMRELEKLGIKTVLCLRDFHDDIDEASGTKLRLVRVELNAWHVDEAEAQQALRVLLDPSGQPVLVHCQHGADRTGLVSALYRMVVQGWDTEAAIDEMVRGGYGYHTLWKGLPRFLRRVDAAAWRRTLGLPPVPPPPEQAPPSP